MAIPSSPLSKALCIISFSLSGQKLQAVLLELIWCDFECNWPWTLGWRFSSIKRSNRTYRRSFRTACNTCGNQLASNNTANKRMIWIATTSAPALPSADNASTVSSAPGLVAK